MTKYARWAPLGLSLVVSIAACSSAGPGGDTTSTSSGSSSGGGTSDAGAPDADVPDTGTLDGGASDAGVPACPSVASGTTYHVATSGNDSGSGTADKPFLTITKALSVAEPGDRVLVSDGVYRERVTFPKSGAPGKPIILEGAGAVTIDGGDRVTGWVPAPEIGANVYKNTQLNYAPWNMTWKGKYILRLGEDVPQDKAIETLVKGPEGWDTYQGTPYRSWDGVEAMFGTYDQVTYVRFGGNNNPNDEDLTFAPQKKGAVNVDGTSYATICNFTLQSAFHGVLVRNGANHVTVHGNKIIGGHDGVMVRDDGGDNVVSNNEITLNYVHSLDPNDPRHWFIWAAFKIWSDYDRSAVVLLQSGSRNVVSGNHIYQHWDGIQDELTSTETEPLKYGQDLKVFNNLIEHLGDDGLEPTGGEINAEYHDNVVHDCNINLRVKSTQGGPMYIYRNRLYDPGTSSTSGENLAFYFHLGTQTEIYIYQNSISGYQATAMGGMRDVGAPNTWYINNIFSSSRFGDGAGDANFPHFDYNWAGGDVTKEGYMGPHNILSPGETLWGPGDMEMLVGAASPAYAKGLDLSKPWTVDGKTHPALPGMSPGYFSGAAPSLGYVQ